MVHVYKKTATKILTSDIAKASMERILKVKDIVRPQFGITGLGIDKGR